VKNIRTVPDLWKKQIFNVWAFPVSVLVLYIILFTIAPDKALLSLESSGKTLLNILVPLCCVFILMFVLNLFVKPSHIVKLLGKGTTIRGLGLTILAGIISMGPIFIWYGLLRELREKGVKNSLLAVFLGNRAIKPFLLPVLISYFGWRYTLILTLFMILGALATGLCISIAAEK